MRRLEFGLSAILVALLISACSPGPRPLQYGVDECDHCRMTLMDERYGGEIVTSTGKIYTFDSVECLVGFKEAGDVASDRIRAEYVADYGNPATLVRAENARYLRSPQLTSPMGANVTAFVRDQDAEGARNVFGGRVVSWTEVRDIILAEWIPQSERSTMAHEGS